MTGQLRALLVSGAHHRNRVQVLPFGAGEHGMMGGSLNLLDLDGGGTIALVENFRTAKAVESPLAVVEYEELFEAVQNAALSADSSADLIRLYLKEYDNESHHWYPVAQVQLQRR